MYRYRSPSRRHPKNLSISHSDKRESLCSGAFALWMTATNVSCIARRRGCGLSVSPLCGFCFAKAPPHPRTGRPPLDPRQPNAAPNRLREGIKTIITKIPVFKEWIRVLYCINVYLSFYLQTIQVPCYGERVQLSLGCRLYARIVRAFDDNLHCLLQWLVPGGQGELTTHKELSIFPLAARFLTLPFSYILCCQQLPWQHTH